MPIVFRSKIDLWLGVLLVVAAVFEVGAGVALFVAPDPQARGFTPLAFFVAGFMLWVLFGTRYTLTNDTLQVRSGPIGWRVPLAAIEEVFPTRSPLSAPAMSLDRLRINHRRRNGKLTFTMVSPADKSGFLDALAAAAPQARIRR